MAKNDSTLRISGGKKWQRTANPCFSSVAATFEKAITYVFAECLIRTAEASVYSGDGHRRNGRKG
jgi:hypothetical protein